MALLEDKPVAKSCELCGGRLWNGGALDDLKGRATISVEAAAKVLGVGRTAAYDAARRGQFPTRRIGRRLRVPVPAFLNWLTEGTSLPGSEPGGNRGRATVTPSGHHVAVRVGPALR